MFLLKIFLGVAVFLLIIFVLALISRINIMTRQIEAITQDVLQADKELEEAARAIARGES